MGTPVRNPGKPGPPASSSQIGAFVLQSTSPPFAPAPVATEARRMAIVALMLLLLARIASLVANRTDLYVDEAQYWVWSQALDWGYYSKPPLIALVIRATTALFGDGEAAVRLAAPVLHAATALVVGRLGERLYGVGRAPRPPSSMPRCPRSRSRRR